MEKTEEKRVAVVTGGNKGIGLEICRQLAVNGVTVILTARDQSRGAEAVQKLNASGVVDVVFHQLDVKDTRGVGELVNFIESRFKKLDILVNNAGLNGVIIHTDKLIPFKQQHPEVRVGDETAHLYAGIIDEPYDLAEECINTNYYGAQGVTEAFLPLLQLSNSPTIVNITSNYGELKYIHNEKVKAELEDIEHLTKERIDGIVQWFLRDLKAKKLSENGWPLMVSAYKVSKAALNAYTRVVARKYGNMVVNCMNPGDVITDMTSHTGDLTPEEGAKPAVMLALLPKDAPSGVYFNRMEVSPF